MPHKHKKKSVTVTVSAPTKGKGAYVGGQHPLTGTGAYKYKGRGSFADVLKYIPRAIGGAVGLATGGLSGAKSGWDKGADVSKMIGLGKYRRMRGRGAYETPGGFGAEKDGVHLASPVPIMHDVGEYYDICRREYVGDIVTGATNNVFTIAARNINPGLKSFLTWGHNIAAQFEQWEPMGMTFHFRSSCSSYAASQALGTITMAVDYNCLNDPCKTKMELEMLSGSRTARISEDLDFMVECSPKLNPLRQFFTRTGSAPSGADLRMYDLGKFQVATQGAIANLNIGPVYVSYHLRFFKPKMGADELVDTLSFYNSAGIAGATPFGTLGGTSAITKYNSFGAVISRSTSPADDRITIPAGYQGCYEIDCYWESIDPFIAVAPAITYTNAIPVSYYADATRSAQQSPADTKSTYTLLVQSAFEITNPSDVTVIHFGHGGTVGAYYFDMHIKEIAPKACGHLASAPIAAVTTTTSHTPSDFTSIVGPMTYVEPEVEEKIPPPRSSSRGVRRL